MLRTTALAATTAIALAAAPAAGGATNGSIAFQAIDKGFAQVFTIEPDGSGLRQVTRVPAKDPEWDPGGENPIWSPDGKSIAFDTGNRKGVNLWTVLPDGSGLTELPLPVGDFNGNPAYSPDGSMISFDWDRGFPSRQHGLYVANSDGTNPRRLTRAPRTIEAHDTDSQWSPDGTRIAFTRVIRDGREAVFVIGVDGRGLKRLTPWSMVAARPDWSPDGRTILFNAQVGGPRESFNLYSMRPDGSGRKRLTHHRAGRAQSFSPSWAPDGSRIVFARFTSRGRDRTELYTADPDLSRVRRLTNLPRRFPVHPDWGPAPVD
jgi:TolB protein